MSSIAGNNSISGQQTVTFTDNASFDGTERGGILATDGQIWMGSTAGNADTPNYTARPVRVGYLDSSDGSVDIIYSDIGNTQGKIDLTVTVGSTVVTKLRANDGTLLVPTLGIINVYGGTAVAGTSPVKSVGSGPSTLTTTVQTSQAIAATDATKVGLAVFDSAAFSVDANGFVTLKGGTEAIDSIGVDATSGGGTNPVLPTAGGLITVNGATVAAGTNPIRTVSTAVNVYQIQNQISQAIAGTDATKIGLSNYNSAYFTVDANGFVNGSTITTDSGTGTPSAGNFNLLGRSGSKISASGATITVKSPPYAEAAGNATSTLNSGSFVTGAFTLTLPASAGLLDGDLFEYVAISASAMIIQAVGAQKIRMGTLLSSAAGTATSTSIGDAVCLRFRAADGFFYATSIVGTWIIA